MTELKTPENAGSVLEEIERIHRNADAYTNNFYAGREGAERWIAWNELKCCRFEHAFFVIRENKFTNYLYYFAENDECLSEALKEAAELPELGRISIDFLGKEDHKKNVFEKAGFDHYITLHRMTRLQMDGQDEPLSYGEFAKPEDAGSICSILEQTMDPKCDRVPCAAEIQEYISAGRAIVVRDEQRGDAVVCILWSRKGYSMEWNYWATAPNRGVTLQSLQLVETFLSLNGAVRRTQLFVRDKNPAASVYLRAGFNYDGLNDYVYFHENK